MLKYHHKNGILNSGGVDSVATKESKTQSKESQPQKDTGKSMPAKKQVDIKDGSVRAIKADLFAHVFSDEEALVELYSATGNKITAEEIEYIDLDDLLQRTGRYRDSSFRTKDWKLIVFNEQQSTPNPNIPYRTLEYSVDTIRSLRVLDNMVGSETGQNIYGTKLIEYPEIKFFVAYNGKKELSEEEKRLTITIGDITVRATVIDINFDKLAENYKQPQSKLGGYAFFVKRFEEHKAEGKTPYTAYDLAVQESLENDYLSDVWSRRECVDVFRNTYSVESEIRQEAREEALEEGFDLSLKIMKALMSQTPIRQIVEALGVTENQVEKVRTAMQ